LLAHKHLHIALGAACGKHAPGGAVIQAHGGKTPRLGRHRRQGGVGGAQHQLPFVKDLEHDFGGVFVQGGRIRNLIPVGVALLHHQQGGGLGQMAVQQFIEFMARIKPGHGCGTKPDHRDQCEQLRQQAGLQRRLAHAPRHARPCGWRNTV
jgi:hypothetical protein